MANFKTHLFAAAGLSGIAALACAKAGLAPAPEIPLLLGLGTLGGLLPDIDSDNSIPLRIAFYLLAFALAFLAMFQFVGRYTVVELAAIWLGVFVGVRYLMLELFIAHTTHRGNFHSLLAVVFFGLGAASLALNAFAQPRAIAWLQGSFVGLGYLVHLTLDEMYSVDLLNRRIKRSFGTALKPVSLKRWRSALAMALAVAALYPTVPPPSGFYGTAWHKLEARHEGAQPWLVPTGGHWFGDLGGILLKWLDPDRKWLSGKKPGPASPPARS